MTTILNFVLLILVVASVGFGWLATNRTVALQNTMVLQAQINLQEVKLQALVNDVVNYNQQAKSPEITRMLQILTTKATTNK